MLIPKPPRIFENLLLSLCSLILCLSRNLLNNPAAAFLFFPAEVILESLFLLLFLTDNFPTSLLELEGALALECSLQSAPATGFLSSTALLLISFLLHFYFLTFLFLSALLCYFLISYRQLSLLYPIHFPSISQDLFLFSPAQEFFHCSYDIRRGGFI